MTPYRRARGFVPACGLTLLMIAGSAACSGPSAEGGPTTSLEHRLPDITQATDAIATAPTIDYTMTIRSTSGVATMTGAVSGSCGSQVVHTPGSGLVSVLVVGGKSYFRGNSAGLQTLESRLGWSRSRRPIGWRFRVRTRCSTRSPTWSPRCQCRSTSRWRLPSSPSAPPYRERPNRPSRINRLGLSTGNK
jgi:hypothetical protein